MTKAKTRFRPLDGILLLDKPQGLSSNQALQQARHLFRAEKGGHTGSLDPLATGLLPLCFGEATKIAGLLLGSAKAYETTAVLGLTTDSDDADGAPLLERPVPALDDAAIEAALAPLRGDIMQVPSSVSAIKVDGQRSYARVRGGQEVELAARPVTVSTLEVCDVRPGDGVTDVDVRVVCSSGTYVRALARDAGAALGVGGHLTMLRRTRVGGFTLESARTLDQLAESFDLLGMDEVARRSFTTWTADARSAGDVRVGRRLTGTDLGGDGGPVAVLDPDGHFLALYEQVGGTARPVAVFV